MGREVLVQLRRYDDDDDGNREEEGEQHQHDANEQSARDLDSPVFPARPMVRDGQCVFNGGGVSVSREESHAAGVRGLLYEMEKAMIAAEGKRKERVRLAYEEMKKRDESLRECESESVCNGDDCTSPTVGEGAEAHGHCKIDGSLSEASRRKHSIMERLPDHGAFSGFILPSRSSR